MVPPFTVASLAKKTHQIPHIFPIPATQVRKIYCKKRPSKENEVSQLSKLSTQKYFEKPEWCIVVNEVVLKMEVGGPLGGLTLQAKRVVREWDHHLEI